MDVLLAAARNNAEWCDAVCRAQGAAGSFEGGLWLNRQGTPRFYPNAITLEPGLFDEAFAGILSLRDAGLAPGWGVKDSFSELDLASLGFRLLFEAQWLHLPARKPVPARDDSAHQLTWRRVETSADLAAWESAWADGEADSRVFLDELLANPDIEFLAGENDGRIEAGAIANLQAGVVGLSNAFMRTPARGAWRRLIAEVRATYPGLDIVDYVQEEGLAVSLAVGFETLGLLRVWEFLDAASAPGSSISVNDHSRFL